MYEEIPHGIAVEPIVFRERQNKNGETVTDIVMNIICEREAHKGMIIGKNGNMLKKIASYAREDIEKLLQTKVYLECHVKVKENWRDNEKIINEQNQKIHTEKDNQPIFMDQHAVHAFNRISRFVYLK